MYSKEQKEFSKKLRNLSYSHSVNTPSLKIAYGKRVTFSIMNRQLTGRVILGTTQSSCGVVPIEIPETVRVRYRCLVLGRLTDIQLPVNKVMIVNEFTQLELSF